MKRIILITLLSIGYLHSQSFECGMSHSEVKKRVHLLKIYENELSQSDKEQMETDLKSYAVRCIASCENEKLMYCADISKKITNE